MNKKKDKKITENKKLVNKENKKIVKKDDNKQIKKESKSRNIFDFFIRMLLTFILVDLVITLLPNVLTLTSTSFKYGTDLILEVFYAIFALIVMLSFKNSYVFTNKQEKFIKSLSYAIPLVVLSSIILMGNLMSLNGFSLGNFINVFVLCIFIGITEEFLCRGWLQNEFLERFGDNKGNIILSIILSSLIFGFMHIINVVTTNQNFFETLMQIINATSIGFFFGIIYYKTKNIWSVIFLHSFYDFAIFMGEINQVKDCTYAVASTPVKIVNILSVTVMCIFWILCALLVLRKCNFPDKRASKSKKKEMVLIILIVISFCCMFLPIQKLADDYDDYETCYTYQTTKSYDEYVVHYPNMNSYEINYSYDNMVLMMNNPDTNDIEEKILSSYYNFKVYINSKNKAVIENINIGYSVVLPYDDISNIEVIENEEGYIIVLESDSVDSTVYYSDYLLKENLANTKDYLNTLEKTFKSFELPSLKYFGYITKKDSDVKSAYFVSENNDEFIIKDGSLFLIRK